MLSINAYPTLTIAERTEVAANLAAVEEFLAAPRTAQQLGCTLSNYIKTARKDDGDETPLSATLLSACRKIELGLPRTPGTF